MTALFLCLLSSTLWRSAVANTEIINFAATESVPDVDIPLAAKW
jgi:hypothetical protein